MGIELFWDDDEQTVMLAEFSGDWSWEELQKTLSMIKRISQERGKRFGAILDLRRGLRLPNGNVFNKEGLEQFQKLLALNDGGSEKGPMAILGMNKLLRMVFDAVANFDKGLTRDVFFADGEEEARRWIYGAMGKQKL